jgi:phage terminase large subunit
LEQLSVNLQTNDCHALFLETEADYYYSIGGRYSAKTYEILQKNIEDALTNPGLKICAARKVYASIKDTLFSDILIILRAMGLDSRIYNKTVSPLHIGFYNDSEIIFKGADDPEKSKGLSGVHRLILDELNEFTQADFEAFDMSIRGKGYPIKKYMAHNPVPTIPGSRYWFQDMFDPGTLKPGKPVVFTDPAIGRIAALKTTYQNNAFCPPQSKRRLEGYKDTNPNLYRLWTLGEYAEMKGVILSGWDVVNTVPEGIPLIGNGLDFGFSSDPAAAVRVWGSKDEIWVKGIVYSTGLLNNELYDRLISRGVEPNERTIADSAEPKTIDELYRRGLRGIRGVKKKPNYKTEMAGILQGMKIHLIAGDIDLQREFSTWGWDEDKTGKLLPRPRDGNDHYIDALIMLLYDWRGSNLAAAPTVALRL